MDKKRVELAVEELLKSLELDIERQGLKDTPRRVAEMYIEQCSNNNARLDVAFQQESYDGMVIVRDIPFVSYCEHHLLPFDGRAHVAYIPRKELLGISKLARLVYSCSKGFTIQETITEKIADWLSNSDITIGCAVVLEAEHGCMNLRGARSIGSSTITSIVRGVFRDAPSARSEFITLLCKGGPR